MWIIKGIDNKDLYVGDGDAKITEKKENKMIDFIKDNVKLTKDAVLVQRYFERSLDSHLSQLAWKDRINELITEAKRLDKESKKNDGMHE